MTDDFVPTPPKPPPPDRAPLPPGRTDFDLPLGPLRMRVRDLPTTWDFVAEHYDPFCEPPAATAPDFSVTCRGGSGVVVPLPPPGGSTVLEVLPEGEGRFRVRSHWQDGFVDVRRGAGEVVLTDRGYVPVRMSLENYLRVACQLMMIERGAFLMHTAGILDGERCYLFFGPSGAGKSTATAHSEPRRALSDDMVLLEVREAVTLAHAVPFFGAFPPRERLRGAWPVAGAFRLRKSSEDRLERLALARAVATVSGSVPFVHELGIPHEGLTRLVARLCGNVPVADLYLTRSRKFWDVIAAEFGG